MDIHVIQKLSRSGLAGIGRVNICVQVDDILAAGKEPARVHFERELAVVFEISTQKNKKLPYLGITIE